MGLSSCVNLAYWEGLVRMVLSHTFWRFTQAWMMWMSVLGSGDLLESHKLSRKRKACVLWQSQDKTLAQLRCSWQMPESLLVHQCQYSQYRSPAWWVAKWTNALQIHSGLSLQRSRHLWPPSVWSNQTQSVRSEQPGPDGFLERVKIDNLKRTDNLENQGKSKTSPNAQVADNKIDFADAVFFHFSLRWWSRKRVILFVVFLGVVPLYFPWGWLTLQRLRECSVSAPCHSMAKSAQHHHGPHVQRCHGQQAGHHGPATFFRCKKRFTLCIHGLRKGDPTFGCSVFTRPSRISGDLRKNPSRTKLCVVRR